MSGPKKAKVDKKVGLGEPPKQVYIFSLTFGDKVYEGSGATLLEALKAVPVPIKIVSKGLLKVVCGEKKFEQMRMPIRLKRLFRPLSQAIQAKQLAYLMR